jgi:hypothetical protein
MQIANGVFVRAVDAHNADHTREGVCTGLSGDRFIHVLDMAAGDETFMCHREGAIAFSDDKLADRVLFWTNRARAQRGLKVPAVDAQSRRLLLARKIPESEIDEFEDLRRQFDDGGGLETDKLERLNQLFRKFANSLKRR